MSKPVHMLSRTQKAMVVVGAALAAMAFSAMSAQATETTYKGVRAEVYSDRVQKICDTETDGNGAFVTVKRRDGVEQNFWDGTGHDGECGGPFRVPQGIAQFKLCEDHGGCSNWIRL